MTTIRRVYLYLASFIGMSVTLAGVFLLIGLLVDRGFDAFRGFSISSSAPALALIVAGGVTWRFYWRVVQREASAAPDERASGTRKLYLYATMTIGLLAALIVAQQVLGEFLVRLLDAGLNGYKPWTPVLSAAVLAGVWWGHRRIADADQAAAADGARGGDLRRGYWFALALFGAFGAANGAAAFVAGLLSHLGGRAPFPPGFGDFNFGGASWIQTLIPPLAQAAASAIAIWMFWLPSQKAAASGDEAERSSRGRSLLIHLVVFAATVWALNGAQSALADVLNRLLSGFPADPLALTINGPLSLLIVGGLLLWYFFRQVRPTLVMPRLSEYLVAGVAFFIALIAAQQLVAVLFQVLGGQGPRIEALIPMVLPGLLVGGGVWRWRWQRLEAEASGAEGGAARSDVWRKVYLYFYHLVGLVMILIGGAALLQTIIAGLLGQPAPGNALTSQSTPLALLLAGSGVLIYMMQIVASDARLGALPVEDVMRQTLGDGVPTWAIAALVTFVISPLFTIVTLAILGPAIGNIFSNIVRGLD